MPAGAITLKGDKALIRKLDRLDGAVARRIMRRAMKPALKPIQRAAKALAPANVDPEMLLEGRPATDLIQRTRAYVVRRKRRGEEATEERIKFKRGGVGALIRKNIVNLVRTYRRTGVTWAGVGIRPHVRVEVDTKRGRKAGQPALSTIAILAEYGTDLVPPQPFIRPAFEQKKLEAVKILGRKAGELIEREAKRA